MHEKTGIRDSLYILLPIYFTLYVKTYIKIKNRRNWILLYPITYNSKVTRCPQSEIILSIKWIFIYNEVFRHYKRIQRRVK